MTFIFQGLGFRMAEDDPRLLRPPCPECRSSRTVETAKDATKETLYCPDCDHHTLTVEAPRT